MKIPAASPMMLLLLAPLAGKAEAVQWPETPQASVCREWLKAMNSGDYEAILAFQRRTSLPMSVKSRALQDYGIYLMTRGLEPESIGKASQTEIEILAQEKLSGAWVSLIVRFAEREPHGLTGVGLRPADPPERARIGQKPTEIEMLQETDALLARMADAGEFSGAVLAAKGGRPIFKKAYGLASQAWGVSNRVDTKFNLASAGKMFTAVAVAQLAEEKRLAFDDTVGKHVPDYPNAEVREQVTIHQLLTHTSGLGDMFNDAFEQRKHRIRTVKEFVELFSADKLEFTPGSRFGYSNAGYCLLGLIIEKVSGEDYYAYLKRRVFDPAGMSNTGAFEMDRDTPNLAIGYTRRGAASPEELRERRNNLFRHVLRGSPAGGAFSTVEDMLAFANALTGHRLLGAEMTSFILEPKHISDRAPGEVYAYGFQVEGSGSARSVGHRGGFDGISADFKMYPELGYATVVLSNYDNVAPIIGLRLGEWIKRN